LFAVELNVSLNCITFVYLIETIYHEIECTDEFFRLASIVSSSLHVNIINHSTVGKIQSNNVVDDDEKMAYEFLDDEFENNRTTKALETINKIESDLKLSCLLQVHQSKQSNTNIFHSDHTYSISTVYSTTHESSHQLPTSDSFYCRELLSKTNPSSAIDTIYLTDLSSDSFDAFLTSNPDMTFKELSNMSMEHDDSPYMFALEQPPSASSYPIASGQDEATDSSIDSSSCDTERDTVNRRGLKKSGGPLRRLARFGNKQVIKYSDEYHDRRVKNNEAVKKSRMKAKDKQKDTEVKMNKLAEENRTLNDRVDSLMKELQVLKSLYKELNQDLPASAVKALEIVNIR
jgi:hypothetical protein